MSKFRKSLKQAKIRFIESNGVCSIIRRSNGMYVAFKDSMIAQAKNKQLAIDNFLAGEFNLKD
jgi:hypothetical protein